MLSPSTVRKYWISNEPTSIHEARSTNWKPPPVWKSKNIPIEMARATSDPSSASQRE